jgi:hypothetical protein
MSHITDPVPCARCGSQIERLDKHGRRQSYCKPCFAQYMRDYCKAHPEKYYKTCPQCGGRCGLKASMCRQCKITKITLIEPRPCVHCQVDFTPTQKAAARFCSMDCRNTHNYRLKVDPQYLTVSECVWCFAPFSFSANRPCCSLGCFGQRNNHWAMWRSSTSCAIPTCLDCQTLIPFDPSKKRCGSCQQAADEVRRGRNEAKRRNLMKTGDADIHWRLLGDRDGWLCHLCGGKVVKTAGNAKADRGATVDHLVPIADGGTHTWDNVALAHRSCNIKRGAGGVAQLRLVG